MANFPLELGTAIQTAMRADASLQTILGAFDGSTYAVEFGDQPDTFPAGHAGRIEVMHTGKESVERFSSSERTRFMFEVRAQLLDVRGQDDAISVLEKGMANVFADWGSAILDTHLVDSANNRLGKSGTVVLEGLSLEPTDDPDRPVAVATVAIELTHASPLT
jgi:hypothetical protein